MNLEHLLSSDRPAKTGRIVVDSREQDERLKAIADEVRLLSYEGDNGENRSFDIEVTTAFGQTVPLERKSTRDAVASLRAGKLDSQVGGAGGLLIEWDEAVLAMMLGHDDHFGPRDVAGLRKRIWRISLCAPVVWTTGVEGPLGTLAFLAYLRDLDKPIESFEARMDVQKAPAHFALLAAMPGLNPLRKLPDGRLLGDVWWERVDKEKLAEALAVDTLGDLPGIGAGRIRKAREFLGAR